MKEIFFDAQNDSVSASPADFIMDAINHRNVRKNTFILERLLCTSSGMPKNADIPYIVKNNFPSKKVMSDILDESKISVSQSYDSIRKVIILLDFYIFWVCVKIGITDVSNLDNDDLYSLYCDEANEQLHQCGYEDLYAGNPYDWIFLCASKSNDPLEYFRACVEELDWMPEQT